MKILVDGKEVDKHEAEFFQDGWPRKVKVVWSFLELTKHKVAGLTDLENRQLDELIDAYEKEHGIDNCRYNDWTVTLERTFSGTETYPVLAVPDGLGGVFCYVFETGNADEPKWIVFYGDANKYATVHEEYFNVGEMISHITKLRADWCFKRGGETIDELRSGRDSTHAT